MSKIKYTMQVGAGIHVVDLQFNHNKFDLAKDFKGKNEYASKDAYDFFVFEENYLFIQADCSDALVGTEIRINLKRNEVDYDNNPIILTVPMSGFIKKAIPVNFEL